MMPQVITCIVNGNAYKLDTADASSFDHLLPADSQQLIALLEVIKRQSVKSEAMINQALNQPNKARTDRLVDQPQDIKPERMNGNDIDALMKKMILEEQQNKKPAVTKRKLYKYIGIVLVVIVLLTIIF